MPYRSSHEGPSLYVILGGITRHGRKAHPKAKAYTHIRHGEIHVPAEAGQVEVDLLGLHRGVAGLVHAGAAESAVTELVRLPHRALLGVRVDRPQLSVSLS